LHPEVKKSAPAKISAIGFIIVVIFGNLWLVNAVMSTVTPFWVAYGFFTGVVLVFAGGAGLGYVLLMRQVSGTKVDPNSTDSLD
jgi:hypothetical protein